MIRTHVSRGAGGKVMEHQNMLTGHETTPSITSEQIIDDRHRKSPCRLTKVENVAEMSSVAESCPRGGFNIQNFLTWMREFSLNSM